MENLNRSAVVGLVFLFIGITLILDNFNFIPYRVSSLIFQWENILILIGGILLITRQNNVVGAILIGLGAFFSFDHWFRIDVNIFGGCSITVHISGINWNTAVFSKINSW